MGRPNTSGRESRFRFRISSLVQVKLHKLAPPQGHVATGNGRRRTHLIGLRLKTCTDTEVLNKSAVVVLSFLSFLPPFFNHNFPRYLIEGSETRNQRGSSVRQSAPLNIDKSIWKWKMVRFRPGSIEAADGRGRGLPRVLQREKGGAAPSARSRSATMRGLKN